MFKPEVAAQVRTSLYVYAVDDIGANLQEIDKRKGLPFWSFMPVDGRRPPRQNPQAQVANVSTPTGNTTLDPSVVPQNRQVPPARQPTANPKADPRAKPPVGRSANRNHDTRVQDGNESRPAVSDDLNHTQEQLIRSLGVVKNDGQDEGVNNRVNASTGKNNSLTRPNVPQVTQDNMKPDQAHLLKNLGIGVPNNAIDPEFDNDITESRTVFEDPSLSQLDDRIVSDEEIKKLQAELDETTNKTAKNNKKK
jgi:hypothetical protein